MNYNDSKQIIMNINNLEILFYKVIHNKFLFKKIIHFIKTIDWYDYFNNGFEFKKKFKHRKSFKNITSFNWMLKEGQTPLLHCKLKNNEYVQTDQNSITNLIYYFNNFKMDSNKLSLYQDIVSLIFRNNEIRLQDYKKLDLNGYTISHDRLLNYFEEEYSSSKRVKYDDNGSNEKSPYSNIPISWHHLIPLMYNHSNNLISILINDKETFDWILNNQNDLNKCCIRLDATFNSFKLAQYAISVLFNGNLKNPIVTDRIYFDYPSPTVYADNKSIVQEPSVFYQHTFVKSIYECNIKELEYMFENNISINWFKGSFKFINIESRTKFSNDIGLVKIIQLIDYLNSISYMNFNDLIFVNFIIQIVNKIVSLKLPESSNVLSFLNKIQFPNNQYLHLLFIETIDKSLHSEIIEFCMNHQFNQIYNHSLQLINMYTSKTSNKINNFINSLNSCNGLDDIPFSNNVDTILSQLELFANYYKNQIDQSSLNACDSIIQYLYSRLIKFSNVSINKLKYIYQVLGDSGIIIQHSEYYSFYYVLKRSPDFINYILKITPPYDNEDNIQQKHLNPSIFTFEFIFGSTYDEILTKLVHFYSSSSITTSSSLDCSNDDQMNGFYSLNTLDINLKFYLSINRFDLFFKLLELIHHKLQDLSFNYGSFPNNIKDENQILIDDYNSSLRNLMISLRKKECKKNIKYNEFYGCCCCGAIEYYQDYSSSVFSLTSQSLINGQGENTSTYSLYRPLDVDKLFSVPFYKFKDWKLQQQQQQEILQQQQKYIQFQSLSSYIPTCGKDGLISNYEKEIEMYSKCNESCSCSNNNNLNEELNRGRIFYPSKKVYYKSFKSMEFQDLMEFIKLYSYRSFIHFLYSYGIKVKPLLNHYQLINHILLNHNHNYQNIGNIEENYQLLLNYWNTVLTFTQIMPKTLFDLKKFIHSNVKPNCSVILNRLMNAYIPKSIYNYRIKKQKQIIENQCKPNESEEYDIPPDEYYEEYDIMSEFYSEQPKELEDDEIEHYFNQFKENMNENYDQLFQNYEQQPNDDDDDFHKQYEINSNNEMCDQLLQQHDNYHQQLQQDQELLELYQQEQLKQEQINQELINSFQQQ